MEGRVGDDHIELAIAHRKRAVARQHGGVADAVALDVDAGQFDRLDVCIGQQHIAHLGQSRRDHAEDATAATHVQHAVSVADQHRLGQHRGGGVEQATRKHTRTLTQNQPLAANIYVMLKLWRRLRRYVFFSADGGIEPLPLLVGDQLRRSEDAL